MVCLMTTITQAQNETTAENDSVAWDKMLSEISVTGHRHIVRMKGNTLVAQVANTELANLGTANDVLSRLPFINMDGDEISIVGKGKPAVFIDNRPVRDESELQMLRSENIKNIQIITSPADAPAVHQGTERKTDLADVCQAHLGGNGDGRPELQLDELAGVRTSDV